MLTIGIGVFACATRPIPDPQFAACPGDRVVIVSNSWRVPIDVYTTVEGQATPMVIGTISPGRREELVLPLGARYANVRATEPMRGGMAALPQIQIRYRCR
jgi:hypothetical protein